MAQKQVILQSNCYGPLMMLQLLALSALKYGGKCSSQLTAPITTSPLIDVLNPGNPSIKVSGMVFRLCFGYWLYIGSQTMNGKRSPQLTSPDAPCICRQKSWLVTNENFLHLVKDYSVNPLSTSPLRIDQCLGLQLGQALLSSNLCSKKARDGLRKSRDLLNLQTVNRILHTPA